MGEAALETLTWCTLGSILISSSLMGLCLSTLASVFSETSQ